ncbi:MULTISPECIES: hypothetical protein [Microbulbifer]|uniref:hypothetical protein n=1 Tax=Microbulbifer TaxID=48073 RepID=UPI001E32BE32|nr:MULTISPECIES: hypothetical protein [Microbulbifer]UHQ54696.1 hypothetical protein LVE68_14485 [Microbulbifer sp. YPW16]
MRNKIPGIVALSLVLPGCAGTSFDGFWGDLRGTPQVYGYRSVPVEEMPAFPRYCLASDPLVGPLGQCLEAAPHCYQLDTGDWCAGPYSPFVLEPSYHAHLYQSK